MLAHVIKKFSFHWLDYTACESFWPLQKVLEEEKNIYTVSLYPWAFSINNVTYRMAWLGDDNS